MSERKVLSKYYPPDFDPSRIVRNRGPKQAGPRQQTVRLMTPFSMRCATCGEYIYKGKKFNARKENSGEKYYTIPIYRFYIRCTRCSAEITFKTDPKNCDYTAERGAQRNFEPWREQNDKEETEEERLTRLEEEENAMTRLEIKTLDSKREMEIADALDDIRTRNAKNERVDADALFDRLAENGPKVETEEEKAAREDAELARAAFSTEQGETVRRLQDDKAPDIDGLLGNASKSISIPTFKAPLPKKRKDMGSSLGIVVKKKKLV